MPFVAAAGKAGIIFINNQLHSFKGSIEELNFLLNS
jgi:hypothetical protein